MGGSKMCSGKAIKRVSIEKDFDNPQYWEPEVILEQKYEVSVEGITIQAVRGKNTANVKVGGVDTEMFVDSGAEVSIVPTYWYKKEMGKLQPSSERLRAYGTSKSLNIKAKFIANMTTNQGACTHGWVYVVEGDEQLQPLLGDTEATALGYITFRPEGREPTEQEINVNKECSFGHNVYQTVTIINND